MDDIIKKLFESEVFNDDTKEIVAEAFKKALDEAKTEQEKAIRAELAERYERDKKAIHLAFEQYLDQNIREHVESFQNGLKDVDSLKVKYAKAIHEAKKEAKKHVATRIKALENAVTTRLDAHLTELHESEKVNRRAYLNKINENKASYDNKLTTFKKTAAKVLEQIIDVKVQGQLDVLSEDIRKARESDFGREIFESFFTVFRRQFFDSNKEVRKVVKALSEERAEKNRVIAESKKALSEAREEARIAKAAKNKLAEQHERVSTMNKLLKNLSGEARSKMKTLLEATQTKDLEKNFKKFLPEMTNRKPMNGKKNLNEGRLEVRTGGSTGSTTVTDDFDDEIIEIKRNAGIK